jgi:hypothetical protein
LLDLLLVLTALDLAEDSVTFFVGNFGFDVGLALRKANRLTFRFFFDVPVQARVFL